MEFEKCTFGLSIIKSHARCKQAYQDIFLVRRVGLPPRHGLEPCGAAAKNAQDHPGLGFPPSHGSPAGMEKKKENSPRAALTSISALLYKSSVKTLRQRQVCRANRGWTFSLFLVEKTRICSSS